MRRMHIPVQWSRQLQDWLWPKFVNVVDKNTALQRARLSLDQGVGSSACRRPISRGRWNMTDQTAEWHPS